LIDTTQLGDCEGQSASVVQICGLRGLLAHALAHAVPVSAPEVCSQQT
jgi:hypothetical protein